MDPLAVIGLTITILIAVIGATWVLAAKLGNIESALRVHVAETEERLGRVSADIIDLKSRRGTPRGRR